MVKKKKKKSKSNDPFGGFGISSMGKMPGMDIGELDVGSIPSFEGSGLEVGFEGGSKPDFDDAFSDFVGKKKDDSEMPEIDEREIDEEEEFTTERNKDFAVGGAPLSPKEAFLRKNRRDSLGRPF